MPDVTDRSWFANTATSERFQPFGRVRDNERSPKERVLLPVGLDTEHPLRESGHQCSREPITPSALVRCTPGAVRARAIHASAGDGASAAA